MSVRMKVSGIGVVLYLVVGTVLMMVLGLSSYTNNSPVDVVFNPCSSCIAIPVTSRKLKENGNDPSTIKKSDVPNLNLEDYESNHPVPYLSSGKPGPIEYSFPIPKPSPGPPDHPKIGGFP